MKDSQFETFEAEIWGKVIAQLPRHEANFSTFSAAAAAATHRRLSPAFRQHGHDDNEQRLQLEQPETPPPGSANLKRSY